MDPRYPASRDDLYNLQMEVKQVQYAQSNHAERLLRLEKRQADDTALKSVWNSPFPGVLGGTPQQGPAQISHNDIFDDLDEQGEQLLGSLHLGPAEEEPVRRGAASRANSVRFDESALQGSSWGGGNNRHSGEFGPIRPGSSLLMERSLSHKSDGRHSSAGHSVHSHHSVPSGRASSVGVDTNYADDEDDSSFDIPGPPVSLFVLGSVPSIVRCWLTTNFAHGTLLYADICTGAQKSTVDYVLIKDLSLEDDMQRGADGIYRVRLNVYLAEAVITQHVNRSNVADGSVPSITATFEVTGADHTMQTGEKKAMKIFVGSDALRLHSADILLSRNIMVLSGNDGERLRVPFVRPEDDAVFRHVCTASIVPEKPKLNANATPFVVGDGDQTARDDLYPTSPSEDLKDDASTKPPSPVASHEKPTGPNGVVSFASDVEKHDKPTKARTRSKSGSRTRTESPKRDSAPAIWSSWRNSTSGGPEGTQRENGPLSGYQPAPRGGRSMKILKPQKSGSSARTGASYEPPPPPKPTRERRKSQASASSEGGAGGTSNEGTRWDVKRSASSGSAAKTTTVNRESRNTGTLPRSANPVGVASAFSWMTPPAKSKASSSATE